MLGTMTQGGTPRRLGACPGLNSAAPLGRTAPNKAAPLERRDCAPGEVADHCAASVSRRVETFPDCARRGGSFSRLEIRAI